ncbi:hypothetical protein SCLCIDRAFT_504019 [Scleroderma citrinum Foug A]|uniref:Uncharacterized protein n=1 Tax=Scleroderma citrinum Foug A TaxID=1036808 RepID=A0A0C3AYL0_9AGAM|nr:hypothetical protein SCLCIDRAFT_504019 [Scleroderma citrinum Foug A]
MSTIGVRTQSLVQGTVNFPSAKALHWQSPVLAHIDRVMRNRFAKEIILSIPTHRETALLDNAAVISKQASKYSELCALIALCNYQDMIILDFTPNGAPWNDLTNPVNYLFSSGNPMTHKQLLIAAFVYGMRKAGLMGAYSEIIRNSMSCLTILIVCVVVA